MYEHLIKKARELHSGWMAFESMHHGGGQGAKSDDGEAKRKFMLWLVDEFPELCDALEKAEVELDNYATEAMAEGGRRMSMERFTKRIKDRVYFIQGEKYEEMIPAECESGDVRRILTRLAAYEDITHPEGNEIITFDRLRELVEADRDGRCWIAPCKVGDTVRAEVNRPFNGHNITIHGAVTDVQLVIRVAHSGCRYVDFIAPDFGKTVFLTHAEAADALAGKGEQRDG